MAQPYLRNPAIYEQSFRYEEMGYLASLDQSPSHQKQPQHRHGEHKKHFGLVIYPVSGNIYFRQDYIRIKLELFA